MEREDIEPWYRHFWPWFIIALLSTSVIAGLTTLWISLQTTDSLVVKSGDDAQMIAEQRISAEQLASELGLAALLVIEPRTGAISVAMQSGVLASVPQRLELEFAHPAFAERDQRRTLHLAQPDAAGNPVWSGHFVAVPEGRWYVTLRSADQWRVTGEWQGESQLTLRPASGDHDNGR